MRRLWQCRPSHLDQSVNPSHTGLGDELEQLSHPPTGVAISPRKPPESTKCRPTDQRSARTRKCSPLSSNGQPATRSRIPNQLDPDAHSENRQENTHQIGLLPKPTGESHQQRCKKQPGPDRSLVNRSLGHSSRWHFHGYFIDVPRQRLGTCASDGRFSPHSDSQSWCSG